MFEKRRIPLCPECGQKFEDVFEAVDHLLEDDEEFDPALILPGGFRLMVGSLIRAFYEHRFSANEVSDIAQDAYGTLFLAETTPDMIANTIEDIIVEDTMENFDNELKKLFKNGA